MPAEETARGAERDIEIEIEVKVDENMATFIIYHKWPTVSQPIVGPARLSHFYYY